MMAVIRTSKSALAQSGDIVRMRQIVREKAVAMGFSLVDQTKVITAASELGRNTLIYGGGGEVEINEIHEGVRLGLQLVFVDRGPGISDVELALKDGYTTGNGLGLGLGGARRLSNEFQIHSAPGEGTRVSITRWR
jgi:serine/threonine-protein kinase RsbT